jgi:gamma-glutamyltranspeptidase
MNNGKDFDISTARDLASKVGRDVLTSGGNAFDAAVAAAVALAVVEPGSSGVGGEGYCIFYDATLQQNGYVCKGAFQQVLAL